MEIGKARDECTFRTSLKPITHFPLFPPSPSRTAHPHSMTRPTNDRPGINPVLGFPPLSSPRSFLEVDGRVRLRRLLTLPVLPNFPEANEVFLSDCSDPTSDALSDTPPVPAPVPD